jgi:phage tail sheath protein FI
MKEAGYDSKYAALYYPWIKVANPLGNGAGVFVPPSGHIAGIWARTDGERGVHKAPANEVVRGALEPQFKVSKAEQDTLNPDGINCIRAFPGRGVRVWGARTLSSDASWRYVNVRRLFNFVEKSIERGTQWVVFEPNDEDLWRRIRRDVTAFLTRVWRDGALFGSVPEEAFYVKCDRELNPPEVRDAGQVVVEVGLAPVKPAEFVIFRISQFSGVAE